MISFERYHLKSSREPFAHDQSHVFAQVAR